MIEYVIYAKPGTKSRQVLLKVEVFTFFITDDNLVLSIYFVLAHVE